jgi:hypothetical protein
LSFRLRIEGRGCPTYVGATLSKMGTCTLDWMDAMGSRQLWPQWNLARDRIFCWCGAQAPRGYACHDSLSELAVDTEWHARRTARTKPAAACGSPWPAGAAHIAAVLQKRRRGLRGVAACPGKWDLARDPVGGFGTWLGLAPWAPRHLRLAALWSLNFCFQVTGDVTLGLAMRCRSQTSVMEIFWPSARGKTSLLGVFIERHGQGKSTWPQRPAR